MATIKAIPSEVMDQIVEILSSADLLNLFVTDREWNVKLHYNMCQKAAEMAKENVGFMSWACYTGKTSLVAMLLQRGVDVNEGLAMLASGEGQFPPWDLSGIHEHPGLRNLAGPSETDVRNFCRHESGTRGRVVFNGNTSGLQEWYDYIFDGHQPRHETWVPWRSGHLDIVKLLVDNGASLDAPCRRLYDWLTSSNRNAFESWEKAAHSFEMLTPLYVAARQGHVEIAKFLVESGASKLRLASQPMSLLHVAAEFSGMGMARFAFEQRHCNVNEPDAKGLTPIWLAYLRKDWELVFYLQDAGGNIDHDLHTGFTPLAHALLNQTPDHAKTLIRAGANVNGLFLEAPRKMMDTDGPSMVPCLEMVRKCIGLPAPEICVQLLAQAVKTYDLSCADRASLSRTARAEKHVSECADLLAFVHGPIDLSQPDDQITSILVGMFNPDKGDKIKPSITSPAYVTKSRARVVDALLQLGGDSAAKDHKGRSLVRLASVYFSFPCITVLARYNSAAIQEFNSFWSGVGQLLVRNFNQRLNPDGLTDFILKELDLPDGFFHTLVDGHTLLHHALFSTNVANLNKLLDAGADVNQPDESGCPLIVQLVLVTGQSLGHKVPAMINTMGKGEDTSHKRPKSITPSAGVDDADWAAFNPVIAIIQSMKLSNTESRTSDSLSVEQWISRLSHLLECAAEEPLPPAMQFRYLEEACKGGHAGAVKVLLTYKNLDIDEPLQDGRTITVQLMDQVVEFTAHYRRQGPRPGVRVDDSVHKSINEVLDLHLGYVACIGVLLSHGTDVHAKGATQRSIADYIDDLLRNSHGGCWGPGAQKFWSGPFRKHGILRYDERQNLVLKTPQRVTSP
ncbi:hypothetical protein B0T22DRAFT_538362 [Podospora appendiculata]|uniref:F-box domain-containing protein n=1 Tax=Podospora appendiculata TaxID=314037 RepID=A0AAE0X6N5_9PEZI|nr:hypothetical protein B0T22DRAFT_538362 [Podospora appendiculata]